MQIFENSSATYEIFCDQNEKSRAENVAWTFCRRNKSRRDYQQYQNQSDTGCLSGIFTSKFVAVFIPVAQETVDMKVSV